VRPVTRKKRWLDPLVALILIFLVPGGWTGALAGTLEREPAPLSSTPDEESEKHEKQELLDEIQIVRARVRSPESPQAAATMAPKQRPVTHQASTLLTSVAPKSHPSRFSVRRQQ